MVKMVILEKLKDKKKKRKVLENAARFFGFKKLLEIYDFRIKGSEVFMLDCELGKTIDELPEELQKKLRSAGIKVGEAGRRYRFTLEGAFFLSKNERKRVYVDRKAEMLFLYGRDVFSSSILKTSEDVKENDIVFVCNAYGDVLGIGRAKYSSKEIGEKGEKVAVENLVDRGEYLRKKKLYSAF